MFAIRDLAARYAPILNRTARSWAEPNFHNLINFNEVDKGGHFAAWEQPDLVAAELRAASRSLR